MCQECLQLEEQMRQEDKAQALLELEDKPQTIDQIIFWLEIGGYSIARCPGFYNGYYYIVAYPNGKWIEALSVEDMRSKAVWVWWQYNLA